MQRKFESWNPVTGCSKISEGCRNCYAEGFALRLKKMGAPGYENGFEFSLHPDRLQLPLKRKSPTWYFVSSMSDVFHEAMPDAFLDEILDVIRRTPRHLFQMLTKRASRMKDYFKTREIPRNLWLGVTVENIRHGLPRIDELRQVAATVRFLSVEPLLEDIGTPDLTGIHWVLVGGESGPKARRMKKDWVLNIRDLCERDGIAFTFRQWGSRGPDGIWREKHENGRLLDGKLYNAVPDEPDTPVTQISLFGEDG